MRRDTVLMAMTLRSAATLVVVPTAPHAAFTPLALGQPWWRCPLALQRHEYIVQYVYIVVLVRIA